MTTSEAREKVSRLVDDVHAESVYLTRRDRRVAAIVDAEDLRQPREDAEEFADTRAVDAAWEETEKLGETPIPWDEVKRELGIA